MSAASVTPNAAPPITARAITKAVVPAAGLGTRLRPLTRAFPKELLPVGREPVLSYIATELRESGITEVLFIVSDSKPQIRDFFGNVYEGERPDLPPLNCEYVTQREQRGSGDALLYAQEWVADAPFVVAFGDCIIEGTGNREKGTEEAAEDRRQKTEATLTYGRTVPCSLFSVPLQRLIATHREQQSEATVLVERVERAKVSRYGVVAPRMVLTEVPTEPFALADIVEKPRVQDAPSDLVIAARWALNPSVFVLLRETTLDARGERNITDAVRALGQLGKPLWAVPLRPGEARRDIGNFESFFAQFVRAALQDAEFGNAARQVAREELNREE